MVNYSFEGIAYTYSTYKNNILNYANFWEILTPYSIELHTLLVEDLRIISFSGRFNVKWISSFATSK